MTCIMLGLTRFMPCLLMMKAGRCQGALRGEGRKNKETRQRKKLDILLMEK